MTSVERAWQVLAGVMDPEVPAVSVVDLGIVRDVIGPGEAGSASDGWIVVLTPTYSGCPATEAIEQDVRAALSGAGFSPLSIRLQRSPAWTTDWISGQGRARLRAFGIVPPATTDTTSVRLFGRLAEALSTAGTPGNSPLPDTRSRAPTIDCPRCGSSNTERLSAFGSTACKALYRCRACLEPFEHFKPI